MDDRKKPKAELLEEGAQLGRRVAAAEAGKPEPGMIDDVTARSQTEQALRQAEQYARSLSAMLQAAVDSLPFDFFAIGPDGRYTLQNASCRARWGANVGKYPEEVAGGENLGLWVEKH